MKNYKHTHTHTHHITKKALQHTSHFHYVFFFKFQLASIVKDKHTNTQTHNVNNITTFCLNILDQMGLWDGKKTTSHIHCKSLCIQTVCV